jgi:hypothetical protein
MMPHHDDPPLITQTRLRTQPHTLRTTTSQRLLRFANHVFYSLAVRKHMLLEGKERVPGSHTLWCYVASMLCTFASRIVLSLLWTWPTEGVPNLWEKIPANLTDATAAWAIVNVAPAALVRRYTARTPSGTASRSTLHAVAGFNKFNSLRKTLRLAASASVGPRLALGAAVGAAASLFKQCTDRVVASKPTPWPVVAVAVLKEYLRSLTTHTVATAAAPGGPLVSIGNKLRCGAVDYSYLVPLTPAGAAWLGRNACVSKAWVLDDVIPHVAHACLLFYLVRLYVNRGLPHTVWGKSVKARATPKARATSKATRSSARVRSRKAKGE